MHILKSFSVLDNIPRNYKYDKTAVEGSQRKVSLLICSHIAYCKLEFKLHNLEKIYNINGNL